MINFFTFLLSVCTSLALNAQEYDINFTASGAGSTINSVLVENLTQGTSIVVYGHGSVLHLYKTATHFEELNNQPEKLIITPNPMEEAACLSFHLPYESNTIINVFGANGKIVISYTGFLKSGNHQFKLRSLNKGIYFVNILSGKKKQTSKLICTGNNSNGKASIDYTDYKEAHHTKSALDVVYSMQYNPNDLLKLTGESSNINSIGVCRTVKTTRITANTTINFNFVPCYYDGFFNYKVVQIGTQTWMAENIKFWGSGITTVVDSIGWITYSNQSICCYYRGIESNYNTYGMLYNYLAVTNSAVCPTGWHVPNNTEWQTLSDNMGGMSAAFRSLKATGYTFWQSGNTGTDESGFGARGAGGRKPDATYIGLNQSSYFWSSNQYNSTLGTVWGGKYNTDSFTSWNPDKKYGYAIRCIKN